VNSILTRPLALLIQKIDVRLALAPSHKLAAAFLLQNVVVFFSFINRLWSKDLEQMVELIFIHSLCSS
jgi:hypothetical protein